MLGGGKTYLLYASALFMGTWIAIAGHQARATLRVADSHSRNRA